MSLLQRSFILVALFSLVLGLSACQKEGAQEGTAEKAGKKVDQAVDKIGDKMTETGKAIGEKTEKTGEVISEKTEAAGEYMDDAAITAKIKAEIFSDPLLKVTQINVTTTNQVVKLAGDVDSQQSIDRAMEIARSVKNVISVENELVIAR
ncbi:MAG: BON domain-containing protein [Proteobacteria bacterium]|nr:BON domain-containing protein [Pseudomonadota bacterium]MBU4470366.1 BON domain-containing protein [Pseudomonadota bacterium]MCG2752777.1 BON domain-containing protein [Desulfobacteraceae bacterium]